MANVTGDADETLFYLGFGLSRKDFEGF